jgi:Protein of unknown function (DUF2934)
MKTKPLVKRKKGCAAPDIRQSTQLSDQSREEIRQRAYELFELGGRKDGHDFDDWLEAESEVTGKSYQQ